MSQFSPMAVEAESPTFEGRIAPLIPTLSPAEQRVARFFLDRREAVLLASAVEIAALAGASDATVVRTARSLGFSGLADLREAVLTDLANDAASPSGRLKRTLEETGDGAADALRHTLAAHEESLAVLRDEAFEAGFIRAVEYLRCAERRHVFGIGPSSAMAEYATLQMNRIGFATTALSTTGIGLADRLLGLKSGDALLMIAYAPIYREVAVTLDVAERLALPTILVSDSLGPFVGGQVREVLPVPRGRAGNLAMHGATLVVIEALVTALASGSPDGALASLEDLAGLRGALDKDWLKRGVRRPQPKR
ncbi:MurR/RpiR family transcriptional regulator [Chelatococcus sp. GCM10030263]|uniref:MurR/RpiR family transcriptional regulator n=1 Tax=Chelatococcus sp. GCM10030263 TaxID=3273387 RepID=UPI003622A410